VAQQQGHIVAAWRSAAVAGMGRPQAGLHLYIT